MKNVKTMDSKVIEVGKTYYYITGCSIKKTRCYQVNNWYASFTGIGMIQETWESKCDNIYRDFNKAQKHLVSNYTLRLETAKNEARSIPALKGLITKIKAAKAV